MREQQFCLDQQAAARKMADLLVGHDLWACWDRMARQWGVMASLAAYLADTRARSR